MHIAIVTAGGAGMFCGSCMHDNTLANALLAAGADVSLLPTYTPIRVDEKNRSEKTVHLGGLNVYMNSRFRWWRSLPQTFKRWFDRPGVINFATRFGVSNDAQQLGELTVDMLAGELGSQRLAIHELTNHLIALKPDVICFSNALLSGVLRTLKSQFSGPVCCLLQGDDIFLDELPEKFRMQTLSMLQERTAQFDGYIVHSEYYKNFMSELLALPREKFHRIPLGIDLTGYGDSPKQMQKENETQKNKRWTIGYFARICPEKGLHRLIEAFEIFHRDHPETALKIGGALVKRDAEYFKTILQSAQQFGDAFEYLGSPTTRAEKIEFFKSLDLFSVPTTYHEPKGISILEAMASGVPVVQPAHGAFPEILAATNAGWLVEPGGSSTPNDSTDANEFAAALATVFRTAKNNETERQQFAQNGYNNVRKFYSAQKMAENILQIFRQLIDKPPV